MIIYVEIIIKNKLKLTTFLFSNRKYKDINLLKNRILIY
jgi:hypothetical protein